MENLSNLSINELITIVSNNKELKEQFASYVEEVCMFNVSEKLDCIKHSLSNWSIGTYQYNFIKVKDLRSFVEGVQKYIDMFGCSQALEFKLIECYTNEHKDTFDSKVEELSDLFLSKEINPELEHIERVINGSLVEYADYLENFAVCYLNSYILVDGNVYKRVN